MGVRLTEEERFAEAERKRQTGEREIAWSYARSLPEKYRRKWEHAEIDNQSEAVTRQAESSIKCSLRDSRQRLLRVTKTIRSNSDRLLEAR